MPIVETISMWQEAERHITCGADDWGFLVACSALEARLDCAMCCAYTHFFNAYNLSNRFVDIRFGC